MELQTTDLSKIRDNLQAQLYEYEALESVYCNPGELQISDPSGFFDITSFIQNPLSTQIPPYMDLVANVTVDDAKFELCINLPHEYPQVEPDIYVRNSKFNKKQHAQINKDIGEYISKLDRDQPCLFDALSWLQDNARNYFETVEEAPMEKPQVDETMVRYWIYSHHIYSKTKKREIVELAATLKLNGFIMPGKPGVIVVEGGKSDCDEWWQTIKSMNWKRIFCKFSEQCEEGEDPKQFLKFSSFEQVMFKNNSIKCSHMDMGELSKFLECHGCGYVFKELFGIEARTSS